MDGTSTSTVREALRKAALSPLTIAAGALAAATPLTVAAGLVPTGIAQTGSNGFFWAFLAVPGPGRHGGGGCGWIPAQRKWRNGSSARCTPRSPSVPSGTQGEPPLSPCGR
ncbi:hypothetical protein [Amycolatopsis sp. cmx-11-51]|uniref:hypothetical protein n=1 Tax=Amycolatopsis sp. cmx-11-51 TaxID=2785797 RepID=UPI0039E341D2